MNPPLFVLGIAIGYIVIGLAIVAPIWHRVDIENDLDVSTLADAIAFIALVIVWPLLILSFIWGYINRHR